MRIVPPGTVGPPSPSERNGNSEANRIDCVRTVHKHRNPAETLVSAQAHAPDALHEMGYPGQRACSGFFATAA